MKNPKITKSFVAGAIILGCGAVGMTTAFAATGGSSSSIPAPVTIIPSNASTPSPSNHQSNAGSTSKSTTSPITATGNAANLKIDYAAYFCRIFQSIETDLTENRLQDAQALAKSAEKEFMSVNQLVAGGKLAAADASLLSGLARLTGDSVGSNGRSVATAANGGSSSSSGQNSVTQKVDSTDKVYYSQLSQDITALATALEQIHTVKAQKDLETNLENSLTHTQPPVQQKVTPTTQTPKTSIQSMTSASSQSTAPMSVQRQRSDQSEYRHPGDQGKEHVRHNSKRDKGHHGYRGHGH